MRGHAGVFYAATPLLIYSDPTGNFRTPPNNVRLFLNNTSRGTIYQQFLNAGVNLDTTPLDKLPIIPLTAVQQAAAFGLGATADPFAGAGTTAVAQDFQNPRSYQGGAGSELRLTSNWTAGVQFNYVNTVRMPYFNHGTVCRSRGEGRPHAGAGLAPRDAQLSGSTDSRQWGA